MNGIEEVQIQSRDFWFKIVDFLQQNWALIDEQGDGKATVFFVHDRSGVFDSMDFHAKQDAEEALMRNGFRRYADDSKAQGFIRPPEAPFSESGHPNGRIYSSGRFWI